MFSTCDVHLDKNFITKISVTSDNCPLGLVNDDLYHEYLETDLNQNTSPIGLLTKQNKKSDMVYCPK